MTMETHRRARGASTRALQLPQLDDGKSSAGSRKSLSSRLAFFRRPLRLRGNSSITVPLGVVIIFPVLVVILILVMFVRHPSPGGSFLSPAGAPPAIRYDALWGEQLSRTRD